MSQRIPSAITIGVVNSGLAIHTRAKTKTDGHSIAIHPTLEPIAGPQPGRKCRP